MTAHIKTVETKYLKHDNGTVTFLGSKTLHYVTIGEATFITRTHLKTLKHRLKDYDLVCERTNTSKGVSSFPL
jgi:hypothetical protein